MRWFVCGVVVCLAACDPGEQVDELPAEGPEIPGTIDWTTPLSSELVGEDLGDLEGETLQSIVSGQVGARSGHSCSACHFDDTVTFYAPEVEQFANEPIGAYDIVDGRTWAGNYGWGARFLLMDEAGLVDKPPGIRRALELYLEAEARRVQPLDWYGVITPETLGHLPEPEINGSVLDDIINSRVSGRPDGLLCSTCHYEDGPIPYRPAVPSGDRTSTLGPNDLIEGKSWAQPGGWGDTFAALGPNDSFHKPDYLRSLFFKWTDDGAQ